MYWKLPWARDNSSASSHNLFSRLKYEIGRVRKDGEPPVRDPESFSRYACDLCHTPMPLSGLRQCVICGRWGCDICWIHEYYICSSCGGIMRLLTVIPPKMGSDDEYPSLADQTQIDRGGFSEPE